jgi:hypothetical protein
MEALIMFIPRVPVINLLFGAFTLGALLSLPACSVNVKKGANGEDKKVDIQTPVGGIHVSKNADPRDTGLPVYPGAKLKEKESSDDTKSANVNISGPGFGVKVVALEYVSGDPPQKVVDFYRDQLKRYGSVLECRTSRHAGDDNDDEDDNKSDNKKQSKELTCGKDNSGNTVELKVGSEGNQRIVAVEPNGKGANFALVYIRTRGKDDMI